MKSPALLKFLAEHARDKKDGLRLGERFAKMYMGFSDTPMLAGRLLYMQNDEEAERFIAQWLDRRRYVNILPIRLISSK